jgi:hypothetical protein
MRGIVFALRGEISLGKNFKGIATGFFFRQCGDTDFKLVKAGESGEQRNIHRRFEVLGLGHGEQFATSGQARQARESPKHPQGCILALSLWRSRLGGGFPQRLAARTHCGAAFARRDAARTRRRGRRRYDLVALGQGQCQDAPGYARRRRDRPVFALPEAGPLEGQPENKDALMLFLLRVGEGNMHMPMDALPCCRVATGPAS